MEEMTINGETYIRKSSTVLPKSLGTKIVIVPNGWIFVGKQIKAETPFESIVLTDASVVRKWRNGRGIGGLAKAEYKDEYTLDACYGVMSIPLSTVIATIDCEW